MPCSARALKFNSTFVNELNASLKHVKGVIFARDEVRSEMLDLGFSDRQATLTRLEIQNDVGYVPRVKYEPRTWYLFFLFFNSSPYSTGL